MDISLLLSTNHQYINIYSVFRKASWYTGRDAIVTHAPCEGGVSDERPEDSADPADSSLIKRQEEGETADHKAGGIR